ncbi:MAG: hypothetical protein J2P48_15775 [Alphaproteobacteria bacterium]|nr:hypothetical protein [Alphaproteobacteria bacterium]
MAVFSILTAPFKSFQESLCQQTCIDLLVIDNHTLADLGLRRADLRAGLWQPTGTVDGEPQASSATPDVPIFDIWPP